MDAADEDLFDLYLDACVAGHAEDPATFLARHPAAGASLRGRLEALYAEGPRGAPPVLERLGEFRIVRELAAGGMGKVYLAVQESLGRDVALKVIHPELRWSQEAHARFRRETLAVARLRHPNVVSVLAAGEEQGVAYLAMELVPGRSLEEVLAEAAVRGRSPPPETVARWGRDLARALDAAHGCGVVHRDVKPSNVRIAADGRPLLVDFGVARVEDLPGATRTGTFTGSPLYAAPEQLSGADQDGRADVYALGATLYQALTGRVPFPGRTLEEVMRRVIAEEPIPPRRLDPSIPRALEIVLLHALEKDPDARYPTAGALADDLDAVLAGRPIQARPPGPVDRIVRWGRTHRRQAVGIGAALLVLAVVLGTRFLQERAAAREREREARKAVAEARHRLDEFRTRRAASDEVERTLAALQEASTARYLTPAEDRVREEKEDAVAAARRDREAVFHAVLELLRSAERLDPGVPGTDGVRAALYAERWRESRAARDPAGEAFYRELLASHDPTGRLVREVEGRVVLSLTTDPPGAEMHLFRYRELAELVPGGEHRLVPVAWSGALPVPAGTWGLRVVRGAGVIGPSDVITALAGLPVQPGVLVLDPADTPGRVDRLLSIGGSPVECPEDAAVLGAEGEARAFVFERAGTRTARSLREVRGELGDAKTLAERGGLSATVFTGGASRELLLPPHLSLRLTAAPVFPAASSRVGTSPVPDLEVAPGEYLVVALPPGNRAAVRRVIAPRADEKRMRVVVTLPGEGPDGFVLVGAALPGTPFWIQEREVTAEEYLAFLNDPETRAEVAAHPDAGRVPREDAGGYRWPGDPEHGYAIVRGGRLDWPVLGVSFEDAVAYARWRTARGRTEGLGGTYALPTWSQRLEACAEGARLYPFGNRFRPKWVKSCFSRPRANPEPVLSYPVDESPYGAYDLAGSAFEWTEGDSGRGSGLRLVAGGCWTRAGPEELFRNTGAIAVPVRTASTEYGFRLVWQREKR